MTTLACIEVGASSCQTVIFGPQGDVTFTPAAVAPEDAVLVMSAPGLIDGVRILGASNLGWWDVDPLDQLGLSGRLTLLRNDAEAAALGEWALRGAHSDLVFVGLGTGVGGAVVRNGAVTANLFGHLDGYSDRPCPCGLTGCLETVAAGWALPRPVVDFQVIAAAVASAIARTAIADATTVVLAGGVTKAHPELIDLLAAALPDRAVEGSAAPTAAKSASAWGLKYLWDNAHVLDPA